MENPTYLLAPGTTFKVNRPVVSRYFESSIPIPCDVDTSISMPFDAQLPIVVFRAATPLELPSRRKWRHRRRRSRRRRPFPRLTTSLTADLVRSRTSRRIPNRTPSRTTPSRSTGWRRPTHGRNGAASDRSSHRRAPPTRVRCVANRLRRLRSTCGSRPGSVSRFYRGS